MSLSSGQKICEKKRKKWKREMHSTMSSFFSDRNNCYVLNFRSTGFKKCSVAFQNTQMNVLDTKLLHLGSWKRNCPNSKTLGKKKFRRTLMTVSIVRSFVMGPIGGAGCNPLLHSFHREKKPERRAPLLPLFRTKLF